MQPGGACDAREQGRGRRQRQSGRGPAALAAVGGWRNRTEHLHRGAGGVGHGDIDDLGGGERAACESQRQQERRHRGGPGLASAPESDWKNLPSKLQICRRRVDRRSSGDLLIGVHSTPARSLL